MIMKISAFWLQLMSCWLLWSWYADRWESDAAVRLLWYSPNGCSVHVCIAIVAIVVHKLHKIVSVRGYFHFETQTFYTDKFHLLQINVRDGIML